MTKQAANMSQSKPCPGLNGVYCGAERQKGQGYCDDHRAEYQRNRYAKIARGEFEPRPYKKRATESDRCPCCGNFKSEFAAIQNQIQVPPICKDCLSLLNMVKKAKMVGNLVKLAKFILAHETALSGPDTSYAAEYQRRLEQFREREGYASLVEVEVGFGPIIRQRLDSDIDHGIVYYDASTNSIVSLGPYEMTYEQLDYLPSSSWEQLPDDVKEYYNSKSMVDGTDPAIDTPMQKRARLFVQQYEQQYRHHEQAHYE